MVEYTTQTLTEAALKPAARVFQGHSQRLATHNGGGRMGESRIEQIKALIAEEPGDAMLRFALGNEYYSLGQYPEAIHALQAALEIDPEYAFVYIQLALAYERTGQLGLVRETVEAGRGPAARNGDPNLMRQLNEIASRFAAL